MLVEDLARQVIEACNAQGIPHMLTGALAFNLYGIPRSTKDVDIVVEVDRPESINQLISRLEPEIEFRDQVQFDTITWGSRHIGRAAGDTALVVELFELFDDPFVKKQFARRYKKVAPDLGIETWLPTAEDLIVQKIRWGRSKDLDDARDVLAVQGPETLDMAYIQNWCDTHGTRERLETIVASLPPI